MTHKLVTILQHLAVYYGQLVTVIQHIAAYYGQFVTVIQYINRLRHNSYICYRYTTFSLILWTIRNHYTTYCRIYMDN